MLQLKAAHAPQVEVTAAIEELKRFMDVEGVSIEQLTDPSATAPPTPEPPVPTSTILETLPIEAMRVICGFLDYEDVVLLLGISERCRLNEFAVPDNSVFAFSSKKSPSVRQSGELSSLRNLELYSCPINAQSGVFR